MSNLIVDNMALVPFVIRRFFPSQIKNEDVYQAGCLGLTKAAQKYRKSRGEFSTFAVSMIRREILIELGFEKKDRHISIQAVQDRLEEG